MKSCPQKPIKQYSNIIYNAPLFCNIFFYYCIFFYFYLNKINETVKIYRKENLQSTVEISLKKTKIQKQALTITVQNCQRITY